MVLLDKKLYRIPDKYTYRKLKSPPIIKLSLSQRFFKIMHIPYPS